MAASIVALVIWPEPWPILVGIGYYLWGYHRAPLVPFSEREFRQWDKTYYRGLYIPFGMVFLGVLNAGWYFAAIVMAGVAAGIEYLAWSARRKRRHREEPPDA